MQSNKCFSNNFRNQSTKLNKPWQKIDRRWSWPIFTFTTCPTTYCTYTYTYFIHTEYIAASKNWTLHIRFFYNLIKALICLPIPKFIYETWTYIPKILLCMPNSQTWIIILFHNHRKIVANLCMYVYRYKIVVRRLKMMIAVFSTTIDILCKPANQDFHMNMYSNQLVHIDFDQKCSAEKS